MVAKKISKKAQPPLPPMSEAEFKKKYTTKSGATDWIKVRGDMLAAYAEREKPVARKLRPMPKRGGTPSKKK